jgi:hypothetical protein
MLTTSFHKDTQLTNRPLTADERISASAAYDELGHVRRWLADTSHLNQLLPQLVQSLANNTTDGKPLRTERAPTKDDIGRRVKVRGWESQSWSSGSTFVGFSVQKDFAVQMTDGTIGIWKYCIIDEESAQ